MRKRDAAKLISTLKAMLSDGSGSRPFPRHMHHGGPRHFEPDSGRDSWSKALEKPDRRSTDSQSIISMMIGSSKRTGSASRDGRQELSREQDQYQSRPHDSFDQTTRYKRGTMDSIVSKYENKGPRDSTHRWVNWQREAELEIERSKMSWDDTAASRAGVESE